MCKHKYDLKKKPDQYNTLLEAYAIEFLRSSFPGFVGKNETYSDDLYQTFKNLIILMASPDPNAVIASWAVLSNSSCSPDEDSGQADLCDSEYTHDNLTSKCYKALPEIMNSQEIEAENCEIDGAEIFAFEDDLQIKGLLQLLDQGNKKQ